MPILSLKCLVRNKAVTKDNYAFVLKHMFQTRFLEHGDWILDSLFKTQGVG
jgi:hypothetical protein